MASHVSQASALQSAASPQVNPLSSMMSSVLGSKAAGPTGSAMMGSAIMGSTAGAPAYAQAVNSTAGMPSGMFGSARSVNPMSTGGQMGPPTFGAPPVLENSNTQGGACCGLCC